MPTEVEAKARRTMTNEAMRRSFCRPPVHPGSIKRLVYSADFSQRFSAKQGSRRMWGKSERRYSKSAGIATRRLSSPESSSSRCFNKRADQPGYCYSESSHSNDREIRRIERSRGTQDPCRLQTKTTGLWRSHHRTDLPPLANGFSSNKESDGSRNSCDSTSTVRSARNTRASCHLMKRTISSKDIAALFGFQGGSPRLTTNSQPALIVGPSPEELLNGRNIRLTLNNHSDIDTYRSIDRIGSRTSRIDSPMDRKDIMVTPMGLPSEIPSNSILRARRLIPRTPTNPTARDFSPIEGEIDFRMFQKWFGREAKDDLVASVRGLCDSMNYDLFEKWFGKEARDNLHARLLMDKRQESIKRARSENQNNFWDRPEKKLRKDY
eukprot:CAMPEP_0167762048 /NCGR_PEP_ID=MMETSP0110_2-20121227/12526_1 /TAXON_ID=629695 /ORGANISM="Gymnochlora sp., Strain CCMP2014" /LENGTH=379 /DNA_ID=CAMNT_0007648829 /DNA_START=395 /DNA_END=1534 /DNA_ORIENTATION=-